MRESLPRLMLVTDRRRTRGRELVRLVAEAARGGAGIIQVREKDLQDDELRALVRSIREAVPEETRVVVNSSVRVARTTGTGLHLPAGSPTGPVSIALRGRSVHDEAEARAAAAEKVCYVIVGTLFPTASKPGHPGSGVALLERLRPLVEPIPIFAIGGITIARAPAAIHAGAHGIAVCSAILEANEPGRVAQALCLAIEVAAGD